MTEKMNRYYRVAWCSKSTGERGHFGHLYSWADIEPVIENANENYSGRVHWPEYVGYQVHSTDDPAPLTMTATRAESAQLEGEGVSMIESVEVQCPHCHVLQTIMVTFEDRTQTCLESCISAVCRKRFLVTVRLEARATVAPIGQDVINDPAALP